MNLSNIEQVKNDFRIFNLAYFNDELDIDDVEIVIENLDTELGYCYRGDEYNKTSGDKITLGLHNEWEDEYHYIGTLLHEMIHVYQIQILGQEPNHEISFMYWVRWFKVNTPFIIRIK